MLRILKSLSAMLGAAVLAAGAAAAQEGGPADGFYPADQFDDLMYIPRQSTGDSNYESILQDIRNANFEALSNYDPQDEIRQIAEPVGLLKVLLTNNSYLTCTASIIDDDLILTNWHCLPKYGSQVSRAVLQMGFYRPDAIDGVVRYDVATTPVESDQSLDYAILRVSDLDETRWGKVRIAPEDPPANRSLRIVHHPQGYPKQITQRSCRSGRPAIAQSRLMHKCDTMKGSSGAPVFFGFGDGARVVALHHAGVPQSLRGFDPSLELNRAVPVSLLVERSNTLRRLASTAMAPPPTTTIAPPPRDTGPGRTLSRSEATKAYDDGLAAKRRDDYATAARLYEDACAGGEPRACTDLGYMIRQGQGRTRNDVEARRYYTLGCDGGNATGCKNLGNLYYSGDGGEQSYTLARAKAKQACDGGHMGGCGDYGNYLWHGTGGGVDKAGAGQFLRKACDGGNDWSCDKLDTYEISRTASSAASGSGRTLSRSEATNAYNDGLAAKRRDDFVTATNLYEDACAGGEPRACTDLGYLIRQGQGRTRDDVAARRYYTLGCDGGNATGCKNLGNLYYSGDGGEQSYTLARAKAKQACDGGHMGGCGDYGNYLWHGTGGGVDKAGAGQFLRKACDGGHSWSCDKLDSYGISRN